MTKYFRSFSLLLVFLSAVTVVRLTGQSPQPQTYSVSAVGMGTVESMFSGKESTLKIFRHGPKELIDVTIAPWEASSADLRFKVRGFSSGITRSGHNAGTHIELVARTCSPRSAVFRL
jgi:hypothetical protein